MPADNHQAQEDNKAAALTFLDQGKEYLAQQLTVALQLQQRATVLTSIFTTQTIAVLGYVANSVDNLTISALASLLLVALLIFVGSLLCLSVVILKSSNYHIPGSEPSHLLEEYQRGETLESIVAGESLNYQERATFNDAIMSRNSRLLRSGALLATLAPAAGILVWTTFPLIATACSALGE